MRYLTFLSVFFLLLPCFASAQSTADFDAAMGKFVKAYNAKDSSAIGKLWPAERRKQMERVYSAKQVTELQGKYGKINSCKFVGIDTSEGNKVAVFKSVFSKAGVQATVITLNPENYLTSIRLTITVTPELKSMFKEGVW